MKQDSPEEHFDKGGGTTEHFPPRGKPNGPGQNGNKPLILSSAKFVESFVPPDYVIFGLLQRRFLYSITGKTGAGKTAILLRTAAHVAEATKIIDRDVEPGRVLYLAGENADDVRMRWIALAQHMGFDLDTVDVHFIPGVFKISEMRDRIRAEIKLIGDVSLIIVDTAAAYFEGDDENSNTQFGDYARRTLRPLTTMPGEPCVVVACHPVKNASDDNLIPRGGGAFLNEMDGNLTAVMSGVIELHWQGKYRGPDFAPIHFATRTVTHERLKDSKGRLIPTVVASPLSEQGHADIAQALQRRQDELLIMLLDPTNRAATQIELARRLGWKMSNGDPYHVLVRRTLKALEKAKLVTIERGQTSLTKKGQATAEKCLNKRVQTTPHGTDFVQTPEHIWTRETEQ
jgi:AAA domain